MDRRSAAEALPKTRPAPSDLMAVAMSRLLHNGESVFHGVASPLHMVAILLAKHTHAPELTYVNITGSVDPTPVELPRSTVAPQLLRGTAALTTLADLFDMSARGALDTAFLGGVQIDGMGRINMSVIGDFHRPTVRLPGGAGSALVLPTAGRTILWRTQHTPRALVEHLDFVTATGHVDRLVTPLCVFKLEGSGFALEQVFPGVTPAQVKEATGFRYQEPATVPVFEPTSAEIRALHAVDPDRVRDIEFR
ncbi:MAG: CoA-transferase subunit beta [Dehalococcoidia bacterium]